MKARTTNRLLAGIISLCMVVGLLPVSVFAAEAQTCPHHPPHTADCGYQEARPCGHQHAEGCYTGELICSYGETAEAAASGGVEHTHTPECRALDCPHERGGHDDACGHAEAKPCEYRCELCGAEPSVEQEKQPGGGEAEPTACILTEGCTLAAGHEGACVTQPPTEDGAKEAACTLTEGCTLAAGHEGACVTQPPTEDGAKEAACTLTEGCTLPAGHEGACVTEQLPEDAGSITVTAFNALDKPVIFAPLQTVWHGLSLPATLGASGYKAAAGTEPAPEPEAISIEGITWEVFEKGGSPAAYEEGRPAPCIYWLRAVLPEGYALGEGAALPEMELRYGMASRAIATATVGAFTVTGDATQYSFDNSVLTINSGATLTIQNTDSNTSTRHRIKVADGATAAITLAGVNIDSDQGNAGCAFELKTGAVVTLTLADGSNNILKSDDNYAGLQVPEGAELTIDGSGSLEATGGLGAGIGGGRSIGLSGNGGAVTIKGNAVVAATSLLGGAGIGGGYGDNGGNGGNGGTVIIQENAKVTATGTGGGAGIGGGHGGNGTNGFAGGAGGSVTIEGNAQVTASSRDGAGIGGGYGGFSNAEGGTKGRGGAGGRITIEGSAVVKATSTNGSGIGGGNGGGSSFTGKGGAAGTIEISGGTVEAEGGYLGIGGGRGIPAGGDGTIQLTGPVSLSANSLGDSTITSDGAVTVPAGATLNIPAGKTLTNSGEITGDGTLTGDGTFGGTGTYTLQVTRTIPVPTVAGKTQTSVTLSAVTPTGDGTVTYAKNTENTAPADGWQTGLTFTGLTPGTTCYFFARVTGGTIYKDVTSTTGAEAKTDPPACTISADKRTLDFGSAALGYATAPAAQTVTITNTGNQKVTLNTSTPQNYEVGALSKTELPAGETATFTVRPKTGLAKNTYTENVTVSNTQGQSVSVSLSFTVTDKPTYAVPVTNGTDGGSSSSGDSSDPEPQSSYKVTGDSISRSVSRSDLKRLADTGKSLTIQNGTANMTFEPAALKAILAAIPSTATNVTFSSAPADLSAFPEAAKLIGNRPVYAFTISCQDSSGKTVTAKADFPAGAVSIALDYTPAAGEAAGSLFMVYVDGKGAVTWLDKSSYAGDRMLAEVSHFSVYGVAYKEPAAVFTDITGHWAKADIEFVAARGLLSGTGNNLFSPDGTLTRGMFVTALGRLAGVNPQSYKARSFTDVKANAYYAAYVEWAAQNNIVKGTGDKLFSPDAPVTREQMAVIMTNYAGQMGYSIPAPLVAVTFTDNNKIGAWAAKEVAAMQRAGIVRGKDGGRFDPQAGATRAEGSAVLRRFVEIVIDPATARGWVKNDSGHWLYYKGGKALTGWQTVGSLRYFFNADGVMHEGWRQDTETSKWYYWTNAGAATGWRLIDGKWYCFYEDGSMAVNTKIDGYGIGPDGKRKEEN